MNVGYFYGVFWSASIVLFFSCCFFFSIAPVDLKPCLLQCRRGWTLSEHLCCELLTSNTIHYYSPSTCCRLHPICFVSNRVLYFFFSMEAWIRWTFTTIHQVLISWIQLQLLKRNGIWCGLCVVFLYVHRFSPYSRVSSFSPETWGLGWLVTLKLPTRSVCDCLLDL